MKWNTSVCNCNTSVVMIDRDVDMVASTEVVMGILQWDQSNSFLLPEIVLVKFDNFNLSLLKLGRLLQFLDDVSDWVKFASIC